MSVRSSGTLQFYSIEMGQVRPNPHHAPVDIDKVLMRLVPVSVASILFVKYYTRNG